MKTLLLTNDDGIDAPGLRALEEAFGGSGAWRVIVLAPDRQRSATGHLVHFFQPFTIDEVGADRYRTSGSPADCVKAAHSFLDTPIDLVVSGINLGPNMGIDVHYSGTVAAAREAVINGLPGLAVSLDSWEADADFTAAATLSLRLADWVIGRCRADSGCFYNLNLPARPLDAVQGLRLTRLGKRVYNDRVACEAIGDGAYQCRLVCDGITHLPFAEGDLDAVAEGFASLTPLAVDATDHGCLAGLRGNGDREWEGLFGA